MKLAKQVAVLQYTAVQYTCTAVQGLADARKRAHRSGLVQFLQSTSSTAVESYRCVTLHVVYSLRTVQTCSARICGVDTNS